MLMHHKIWQIFVSFLIMIPVFASDDLTDITDLTATIPGLPASSSDTNIVMNHALVPTSYNHARVSDQKMIPNDYLRYEKLSGEYLYVIASDGQNIYPLRSKNLADLTWNNSSGQDGNPYLDLTPINGYNYAQNESLPSVGLRLAFIKNAKIKSTITVEQVHETLNRIFKKFCNDISSDTKLGDVLSGWRVHGSWYTNGLTTNKGDITTGLTVATAPITIYPISATYSFRLTKADRLRYDFISDVVNSLDTFVGGASNLAITFSNVKRGHNSADTITISPTLYYGPNYGLDPSHRWPRLPLEGPAEEIYHILTELDWLKVTSDKPGVIIPINHSFTAVTLEMLKTAQTYLNQLLQQVQGGQIEENIKLPPNSFEDSADQDSVVERILYFGAVGGPAAVETFRVSYITTSASNTVQGEVRNNPAGEYLQIVGVWYDDHEQPIKNPSAPQSDPIGVPCFLSCDLSSNMITSSIAQDFVDARQMFAPAWNTSVHSGTFPTEYTENTKIIRPAAVFNFTDAINKNAAIILYAPNGISLGANTNEDTTAADCASGVAATLRRYLRRGAVIETMALDDLATSNQDPSASSQSAV